MPQLLGQLIFLSSIGNKISLSLMSRNRVLNSFSFACQNLFFGVPLGHTSYASLSSGIPWNVQQVA